MDRRLFIASLAALPAAARAAELSVPSPTESLPLWQGFPPGSASTAPALRIAEHSPNPENFHNRVLTGIAEPTLYIRRPERPDGSALLIVPGGGYRELWVDNEGFDVANRLVAAGVTCFVLVYRLPSEGWLAGRDVPLQDAQRAMRLIKANAARFGIDPARTGVMGFSAGGHLAASLAVRASANVYEPRDAADALSAAPAYAALLYPVVTMLPPFAHEASREMLLGANPSAALREGYSVERFVARDTPPTFLVDALDDDFVSPENTLLFCRALRAAQVPTEMHLFERGNHGFGIRGAAGLPVAAWPDLFLQWGASRGYFRGA
jgi:acetyl esterase/lipase